MPEAFLRNTLQQLIYRWSEANFQYKLIADIEKLLNLSLYSTHTLYDFSDFAKSDSWTPESWLQPTKPAEYSFNEYCFGADNTPLMVKKYYNGIIANIGLFIWKEQQWEYIEFNVVTLVCSTYCSIYFKNERKDLFLSLRLNGGSFQYGIDNTSAEEIARKLSENSYGFFAEINRYNYEAGRIITADSLSNIPGIGEYITTDYYTYNSKRKLHKITAFDSNEKKQIVYITLSGKSVNKLIKSVAEAMAEYVIACISQIGFKKKISCIALNYQYCYSYWPSFSIISEEEMLDDMNVGAVIFPMGEFYSSADFNIPISEKFLEDFAELEQYIHQKDKQELGRKMLLETARLMTRSRFNKVVAVTKEFFTFPFDFTLHSPPSKKILKACDASTQLIKAWKKLKWLEDETEQF